VSSANLELRGVGVRYPGADRDAVIGVDLNVAPGEFLVFLGASGSGKSTLLRTINRLVIPTAGSVFIDGQDAAARPPPELRLGPRLGPHRGPSSKEARWWRPRADVSACLPTSRLSAYHSNEKQLLKKTSEI